MCSKIREKGVLLFPDLFKPLVAAGALEAGCLGQHGVFVLCAHFRSQALELTCTRSTQTVTTTSCSRVALVCCYIRTHVFSQRVMN